MRSILVVYHQRDSILADAVGDGESSGTVGSFPNEYSRRLSCIRVSNVVTVLKRGIVRWLPIYRLRAIKKLWLALEFALETN